MRGRQTTIRSDMYHNIRDTLNKGDSNPENVGKAIILPTSFTGSKRYMNQYFKDAMAICRTLGHPSLFLTMTTNTKWPEIQRMIKFLPGVDVVDALDVVARVFKMKVDQLLDQIKNKNYSGCCIREFQKRGLTHAHMLIWLHPNDRPKTTEQIDKIVSAEIPDPSIDPVSYEAVKNYMIHGSYGTDCVKSPCMIKGRCIKYFPKRYNSHTYFDDCRFPIYKRRKTGITVKKEIEKLLNDISKSLRNFPYMPYPRDVFSKSENRLILEKTSYTTEEMKRIHTRNHSLLNDEQKIVYDSILDNINQKKGGVFFVYGSGGCGKTFLWQTLCCQLRSEHKIVLLVASCGIAALLLPGGRIAHSRFHISLKLDENCSVGLRHGTNISELLQRTDLIIWDEAPM
ncbi:uncharacterized protein LOC141718491 [Apium graveolens]|uniref:uncharacterized protein LOC141718491 n=1 Tax=Apium graveolens TaxID=4045 RepID=UPI003D7C0822